MPDISGFIEHFPYLGLFVLLVLGGIGLPFPEDATLMLCGLLISSGYVKPFYALTAAYAGLLSADLAIFYWGWRYGRKVVTMDRFKKVLTPERLKRLEERFSRQGVLFILLGRHLVGLRVQIFLVAGIMRMPPPKFLLSDAISAIFTMVLMVGAGYAGAESIMALKKDITRVEHVFVLLAIAFLVSFLVYRFYKARKNIP